MDFEFTEEQNMFRDTVRKVMDKVATPEYVRRCDREAVYPYELYDAWVETGMLRMPFPEAYDGLGGNALDMMIIAEEISHKCFDFVTVYTASVFCGLNIVRAGTEDQKRHWIPKLLSGEIKMAVSMSEPDAGSDVGSMRTRAQRDGDHWVINGEKLWSTGASADGIVINAYVKTDTKVHYREGISLFLVDKDMPGVTVRRLDMLGRRSVGLHQILFNDVRVPAERLVGGENKAWNIVLSGLQLERLAAAAGYWGGAQAVIDLALQYAKDRKQFGRPIGSFQAIAHMIADMQTEVDAARLLTWRAGWKLVRGEDALREISMAKLYTSETFAKVANMGMQIMGAYGYNMEFDMQRYFRDSRSVTIGAGTSQMQRNLIAGLMGLKVQ